MAVCGHIHSPLYRLNKTLCAPQSRSVRSGQETALESAEKRTTIPSMASQWQLLYYRRSSLINNTQILQSFRGTLEYT